MLEISSAWCRYNCFDFYLYITGIVAAEHAGPAVALSFLIAAIVAGLVAFTYAEMSSAMPFAGSAYSMG